MAQQSKIKPATAPKQDTRKPNERAAQSRPQDLAHYNKLFPCSFRGLQFPVTYMNVSLSQDMAEHKYYGVSSANVEMTGRNPLTFEAEIPFIQGLVPAKNERWSNLYPSGFKNFLAAMHSKETGILDTPEIAGITVKPVSLEYKHDANVRNGVIVVARWIETVDDAVPARADFNPLDRIRAAAKSLDSEYDTTGRLINGAPETSVTIIGQKKKLPVFKKAFSQFVNELSGVVDTASSKIHILANKPAQMIYRLKKVQDSIERAANPLTWPGRESCEQAEAALRELKAAPAKIDAAFRSKPIGRYTTYYKITLSQIAIATANSVDQLIRLNPRLASRPAVPAGTVVRYYKNGVLPV